MLSVHVLGTTCIGRLRLASPASKPKNRSVSLKGWLGPPMMAVSYGYSAWKKYQSAPQPILAKLRPTCGRPRAWPISCAPYQSPNDPSLSKHGPPLGQNGVPPVGAAVVQAGIHGVMPRMKPPAGPTWPTYSQPGSSPANKCRC